MSVSKGHRCGGWVWAPGKPNAVRENVGTDAGTCRFQGRTDIWEGANVGTNVVRYWFFWAFGPLGLSPTR
eukprot:4146611-Karenia_brevis.AAC.1